MNFKIDPEFRDLLPSLTEDEFRRLSIKIELEGADRLTVAKIGSERLLMDGHNTHRICQEKGIRFEVREIPLPNRELARDWIINNQLARRNLTDQARAYFIGKRYLENKGEHGGSRSTSQSETLKGDSAEKIAEEQGVSRATVERNAQFAEAVDKIADEQGSEAKAEILSGKTGKSKKKIIESTKPKKPKPAPARAEMKDKVGNVLPDRCRDAFADPSLATLIEELAQVESLIRPESWTTRAGKLTSHYGFILIEKFKEHVYNALESMQLAGEALKAGIPHAVCPTCQGTESGTNGKCCKSCRGYGHVPAHRYEELTK